MRIFLYEHVTGGGMLGEADEGLQSLFPEAAAMLRCAATDFAALPDVQVELLADARQNRGATLASSRITVHEVESVAERDRRFDELAAICEGVFLIAPESGGALTALAQRVEQLGGTLFSPSSEFCAWASDKSRVAETLCKARPLMPAGIRLEPKDPWPDDFPLPAVLKPNDGCGTQAVYWLDYPAGDRRTSEAQVWRLEMEVEGESASVAMLGGAGRYQMSTPCRQRFDADLLPEGGERLKSCGGWCSMPDLKHDRFVRLLQGVWPMMPDFNGYIGLDVVLGTAADGSRDYVIEVNPRLTTSYIVQRELIRNNLMQVLLELRAGRETPLEFRFGSAGYDSDGEVTAIVEAD